MSKPNWIKSPWTISLGTAIFSLFLTILYDYSKKNPFLTTLIDIVTPLWTGVLTILNFELRLWWLLVGLTSLLLILYIVSLFQKEESFSTPDFFDYVEAILLNWRWTWCWKWNELKKVWIINDLTAHCPKCDTLLIEYSGNNSFECPRCNFFSTDYKSEQPHKIERIILDNIERKRQEHNRGTVLKSKGSDTFIDI